MSITDELRKYANRYKNSHDAWAGIGDDLDAIADRIDAEHERQLEVLYRDMSDAEYFKLPKDADGEIIHVGDMMERGKTRGHVIALMLSKYPKKWGGELHWGIQLEGELAPTALDLTFHHYHKPTVEDMLWELLGDIRPDMEDEEAVPIVAAYAKRLRLADDGKGQ